MREDRDIQGDQKRGRIETYRMVKVREDRDIQGDQK